MSQLPPDNVLSADAVRDPQGFFRRLREHDPVFWSPRHKVWILTCYADVDRIYRDSSISAGQMISSHRRRMGDAHAQLLKHSLNLLDGWMLFNDPPAHTRLRDPVRRSFSPRIVAFLEPRIQQHVDQLLDCLQPQCDLVADFAKPLTARVICDLLGVDTDESDYLHGWSKDFGKLIYGASSRDEDYLESVARAGDRFHEHFSRQIERARAEPTDEDLLSQLILASQAEQWTENELVGACSMLLFAGHDTSSALIASGIRALLQHPQQLAQLVQNPSLMTSAVEELLRYDGPSKINIRLPLAPLVIGDHQIEAKQPLWLGVMAANHDPTKFDKPERLDLERAPNPHIAFGAGIHFCLGPALARAEARIAYAGLFQRFPKMRLLDGEHQHSQTIVDRSLLAMPVSLGS